MYPYKVYHLICFGVILLCAACTHSPNSRLVYIQELSDSIPAVAYDSLRSINPSSLPVDDRYLYDFLKVKLTDKTYSTHHSDSLINRVIDYAADNWDQTLYAEALYYGGRVNADLKQYKAALQFFKKALNTCPESDESLGLRSRILSQNGRLLNHLNLYNEAVPNLESAIEINTLCKDSVNAVYDMQLLSNIYLRKSEPDLAEECLNEAEKLSPGVPQDVNARTRMSQAATYHQKGDNDRALQLIRDTPDQVPALSRNTALIHASIIYFTAGILDTAYIYAKEIIDSDNPSQKEIAYQILLSQELSSLNNPDSLYKYAANYTKTIMGLYDNNENQLSIIQQAAFNYDDHDRKRAIAERRTGILTYCLIIAAIIIIIFGLILLYIRKKHNNVSRYNDDNGIICIEPALSVIDDDTAGARERLREELLNLYKSGKEPGPNLLMQTEAYNKLMAMIAAGTELKNDSDIWTELYSGLNTHYPDFLNKLHLLSTVPLNTNDIQTAILIKYGVSPSKIAKLFIRTKGAVSSRRENLGKKLFDEKLNLKAIDRIIRII